MSQRISTQTTGFLSEGQDTVQDIRKTTAQQQDQLNRGPFLVALKKRGTSRVLPRGVPRGTTSISPTERGFQFTVYADKGTSKTLTLDQAVIEQIDQEVIDNALHALSIRSGTLAVTDPSFASTYFPEAGDWGFYRNTSTNQTYILVNRSGTAVETLTYSTLGVTLSFTDISGTITAAQHGQFTPNSATNEALHAAVTSTRAGFMLAADKVKLDAATASPTISTIAMRDASADCTFRHLLCDGNAFGTNGFVDCTSNTGIGGHYRVEGTRVVSLRQAAIADANTGAPSAADCAARINDILAALRPTGHGLIAV